MKMQKDEAYKAFVACNDFEKYYFLPPSREPMSQRPEQACPCSARSVADERSHISGPVHSQNSRSPFVTISACPSASPLESSSMIDMLFFFFLGVGLEMKLHRLEKLSSGVSLKLLFLTF